jgi:hypothetical protein
LNNRVYSLGPEAGMSGGGTPGIGPGGGAANACVTLPMDGGGDIGGPGGARGDFRPGMASFPNIWVKLPGASSGRDGGGGSGRPANGSADEPVPGPVSLSGFGSSGDLKKRANSPDSAGGGAAEAGAGAAADGARNIRVNSPACCGCGGAGGTGAPGCAAAGARNIRVNSPAPAEGGGGATAARGGGGAPGVGRSGVMIRCRKSPLAAGA